MTKDDWDQLIQIQDNGHVLLLLEVHVTGMHVMFASVLDACIGAHRHIWNDISCVNETFIESVPINYDSPSGSISRLRGIADQYTTLAAGHSPHTCPRRGAGLRTAPGADRARAPASDLRA
ncbi:hypothetical protein ACJJTC_008565 [Scirpophaga incertulas]